MKRPKKGKKAGIEIVIILVLGCLASIYVTFHKTAELVQHHTQAIGQKHALAFAPVRPVRIQPLKHENILLETMKQCLPQANKKCKTYIPENSGQRVALLAPPGDMTYLFFHLLEYIVARTKKKREINMELILTTHMAPYGYGKTHGLTRIIRVVPQPFLLGVTNTLQKSLEFGQSQHEITLDDVKASLRQQVRYHCRLSHIAAHTALWTITVEELFNSPVPDLITRAQDFLGLERESLIEEEKKQEQDDDLVPPEDMRGILKAIYTYGSSMLTFIQSLSRYDVLKVLDDVLIEELRISKNLSAWPCESFWTVGEPSSPLHFTPLVARISKALSPNCTAPLTSCFVKRDQCEAAGDGACS